MYFCHFHNRLFQYHLLGPSSFRGFNGDLFVNATFIYCRLFLFYLYKFFSISFNLKKVYKVREVVEQFKEIGIVPIIIILEFVSLIELQIGLTSSVALLPNFIFFGIGIAFSFNFSDFLVFFYGASLGASLSCLFSIALCICTFFFLSSGDL